MKLPRIALFGSVIFLVAAIYWMARVAVHRGDGDTIVLGAILPLTGDIASYGISAKRGIDLAVEELNAVGGVQGSHLRVIYEDDQGQPTRAVAALQKLISIDGAPLVMGSAASSVTIAMCPLANRDHVLLISPISSSVELTELGGPFFFRICPSDAVQAAMMADWLREDGNSRAAVLFVNNSWGQGLLREFRKRFEEVGGQIVAVEACNEGDRDLRTQVSKLSAAEPDAIYAITYGREGGLFLRQARELAINTPIYGADVWGSPELLQTAQGAADGVKILVPSPFASEKYDAFSQKFIKKYHERPDTYASYAYDMVMIVATALQSARRGDDLRDFLRAVTYDGVTGPTKFNLYGDVVGKDFSRKVLGR